MIAELPDGTELQFPDTMTDAQVGAVVKRILAAEKKAALAQKTADEAVASARTEMETLRSRVDTMVTQFKPATPDNASVLAALASLNASIAQGFDKMVKAQLADTVLVRDDTGEAVGSKKVPK